MAKINTTLFGEIALLPFQPQTPLKEILEWLTYVSVSHDGTETRSQTRQLARQTFEYNVPLTQLKKSTAFNLIHGALREEWALPIWTETQSVGNVVNGTSTIICDTENYDFRNDSLAFLYGSDSNYQIVEIQTVNVGSIDIYGTTGSVLNAHLMPVRFAMLKDSVGLQTTGFEASVKLVFRIFDLKEFEVLVPTQYDNFDVYTESYYLSQSGKNSKTIQKRQDLVDFSIGDFQQHSPWLHSKVLSNFQTVLEDEVDVVNYKQFLYRRAGKFRSFWMPTFESDLRFVRKGVDNFTFVAKDDCFSDYALVRNKIAIYTKEFQWVFAEIVSSTDIGNNEVQFVLDVEILFEVEDMAKVCYLTLNRLATDRVEFDWVGNKVAKSGFNYMEVLP